VEIFTNEQHMKCYFCGGIVTREKVPICFDWCEYAERCRSEIEAQRRPDRTLD
jgi:hypothetical protein